MIAPFYVEIWASLAGWGNLAYSPTPAVSDGRLTTGWIVKAGVVPAAAPYRVRIPIASISATSDFYSQKWRLRGLGKTGVQLMNRDLAGDTITRTLTIPTGATELVVDVDPVTGRVLVRCRGSVVEGSLAGWAFEWGGAGGRQFGATEIGVIAGTTGTGPFRIEPPPPAPLSDFIDNLRLEVETPTEGLPNLIQNPSGEFGTWGWETPVANTTLETGPFALGGLFFETSVTQPAHFTSEFLPVAAGKYVASRLDVAGAPPTGNIRIRYQWFNAAKSLLSTSVQSGALIDVGVKYGPSVAAPVNTAFVRLRVDLYSGTGTANPGTGTVVIVRQAMVTFSDTGTPSTTRTNLVRNPSFETNTSGWTVDAGTLTRVTSPVYTGSGAMRISRGGYQWTAAFTASGTSGMPITGGKTYTLSAHVRAVSGAARVGLSVIFYKANGNGYGGVGVVPRPATTTYGRLSSQVTAPSDAAFARVQISTADADLYVDAVALEEGELQDYFDGNTPDATGVDYAWTGTANNSASTRTTFSSSTFDYEEPNDWRNILGPTHSMKITREALNVGTLDATIYDALLDPATVGVIRPGKQIRLRALIGDEWESVYEGRVVNAKTNYQKAKGGSLSDKGAVRIELTASDNIAHLSNQGESRAVATIPALPFLLEGKSAPWNVNGKGNQIGNQTVVATNDNASVLDQVAVTRDTALGYAWVDRNNVLQVWDTADMHADAVFGAVTAEFSDQASASLSYTDIDVSYDMTDCINSVLVKFLRYKPIEGATEEVTYGPFEDADSVATYGARQATFTIVGFSENPTQIESFAQSILASNAIPQVRCNSFTMPVRNVAELEAAARLDLYSLVDIDYEDRVDDQLRVTGLEHNITADRWAVTYSFSRSDSVASPTWTPSPPVGGITTGWQTVAFQNSWANYGAPYAPASYRREGNKVFLRGLVRNGIVGSSMLTLPTGFRPPYSMIFDGVTNSLASGPASSGTAHTHVLADYSRRININSNGEVICQHGGNGYVSLDGISFFLD